jgi:hypothetical protein
VRGVQLAHVGLQLLRPRVEVVHALLYGHGVAGWVGGLSKGADNYKR